MTNSTATGLVERSTSWIENIPRKVGDFEYQSSSPKDFFYLHIFFRCVCVCVCGGGGGGGGVGTFGYQWYDNLVHKIL